MVLITTLVMTKTKIKTANARAKGQNASSNYVRISPTSGGDDSSPSDSEQSPTIKDKISFVYNELKSVSLAKLSRDIARLTETINSLQQENRQKDERIVCLENRLDALEQYTRMDDLVVSGLALKHRTYARAAAADDPSQQHEHAPQQENIALEDQVIDFFNQNDIPIAKEDISACHTLPAKDAKSTKPIILRLTTRKAKINILRNAKNLKTNNHEVYINEHLTMKNANVAKQARALRASGKLFATWTRNCCVFIKAKETDKPRMIKSLTDRSNM